MQNLDFSNPQHKKKFLNKLSKRKVFLSNELKKALLITFLEAKKSRTYITTELLLYGLISQSKSIAAKLILQTFSQFRHNKSITSQRISNRIYELNQKNISEKLQPDNEVKVFSSESWSENEKTPWLSTEVKDILKAGIRSSLKKNRVVVVKTKHILFELLNKEYVRNFLCQLIK